jgi:hypothetical protein
VRPLIRILMTPDTVSMLNSGLFQACIGLEERSCNRGKVSEVLQGVLSRFQFICIPVLTRENSFTHGPLELYFPTEFAMETFFDLCPGESHLASKNRIKWSNKLSLACVGMAFSQIDSSIPTIFESVGAASMRCLVSLAVKVWRLFQPPPARICQSAEGTQRPFTQWV